MLKTHGCACDEIVFEFLHVQDISEQANMNVLLLLQHLSLVGVSAALSRVGPFLFEQMTCLQSNI